MTHRVKVLAAKIDNESFSAKPLAVGEDWLPQVVLGVCACERAINK